MSSLVMYRNGSVYSPADPFATAMLLDGDTVAWIGQEAAADSLLDERMTVIDLRGALVAPAFFDSHVNLAALGESLGEEGNDDAGLRARHRAALRHLASRGVAGVAEMAAPGISGRRDAELLAELVSAQAAGTEGADLPLIRLYWGELVATPEQARQLASEFGGALVGLGGRLDVDGTYGPRTAAVTADYADAPGTRGELTLHAEQIGRHLVACVEAGLQPAFRVVGDAAARELAAGLAWAIERLDAGVLQSLRPRAEFVELVDETVVEAFLSAGVTASMQPSFDAGWGQAGGLYEKRLGAERAAKMNQVGRFLSAGVPVALGSAAPATDVDPWATVRACLELRDEVSRISARAAFVAHTRAGYRAAGVDAPFAGQLVPGAPATFAVWSATELMVQTPDARVAAWSTDARAGTPMLPALDSTAPEDVPQCLQTVRSGQLLFQRDDFQEYLTRN